MKERSKLVNLFFRLPSASGNFNFIDHLTLDDWIEREKYIDTPREYIKKEILDFYKDYEYKWQCLLLKNFNSNYSDSISDNVIIINTDDIKDALDLDQFDYDDW